MDVATLAPDTRQSTERPPAPNPPALNPPALGLPADPAALVPDVRRIAILRANGLGDLVVSEPALAAVRAAYPEAEITLLGQPHSEALLAGRPSPVDRVIAVPKFPGVRVGPGPDAPDDEVEAWCAARRAEGYDLAIQMHGGGGNSNRLLLRLGARVTAGTAAPGAPRPDRWLPYTPYQHDTLRWNELAASVGAPASRVDPRLTVTAADLEASRDVVAGSDRPLVVVHPGATDARRCYPEDRLGAVAASLEGARVVVVGGESEDARVAAVAAGYAAVAGREPETVVGTLSLPGLVGLLSRARLMIGNDSGPRHVAGAVGTPTVAVFTYANLADVAPLTRVWHRVLVSWHGGCRVCGMRVLEGWCGHQESATHDVPLDDVREAAQDLWEQSSLTS